MARAHVIYDYPLHHPASARSTPRDVWYRSTEEEPVVVPKNGVLRAGGGLLLAAMTGVALVAGSAYAVINAPAPPMAETPSSPLLRGYTPDTQFEQANVTNELSGPALAVPQTGAASEATDQEPIFNANVSRETSRESRDNETFIDDSAAGVQPQQPPPPAAQPAPVPEPAAPQTPTAEPPKTYPNPTTTPPDGYAPNQSPVTPLPKLDPENPYF